MHTAVHNLVAQGRACTLGQFIIDDGIASHLDAPVTACPVLRLGKQLESTSSSTPLTEEARSTPVSMHISTQSFSMNDFSLTSV